MTLNELKTWINSLPADFMSMEVVAAKMGKLTEDLDYRLDMPILTLSIDEKTKEALLFVAEDCEGGSGDMATLDSVSGMGEPVLAGRGITGSGDITLGKKKKRAKKVESFKNFK